MSILDLLGITHPNTGGNPVTGPDQLLTPMNLLNQVPGASQDDVSSLLPSSGGQAASDGQSSPGITPRHISPLRDIVGSLADGYIMAHGGQAVYAPARIAQKQADALQGFTDDPLGAIQRLGATPGGAKLAAQLYTAYQTHQGTAAKDQAQTNLDKANTLVAQSKLYPQLASFASTAIDPTTGKVDPQAAAHIAPIIQAKAQEWGLTIPDLDPNNPGDFITSVHGMGIDAYKQMRAAQMAEGLGIQQQNADTNAAYRQGQTGQGATRIDQGQQKIDQQSPNDVLGGIYAKIAAGQRISQSEKNLYNDSMRSKIAAGRNADTNIQNANTRAAAVNLKNGLPPFRADANRYPNGVNNGTDHYVVVGGQWVKAGTPQ